MFCTISENLADIYQALRNFVEVVRGGQQKKTEKLVDECSRQTGRVLGFFHEAWQDDAEYLQLIEAMTQHEATVLFLHEHPQRLYEEYIPRLILEDETKALLREVEAMKNTTI